MTGFEDLFKMRRLLFENNIISLCLKDMALSECVDTLLSDDVISKVHSKIRMGMVLLPLACSGDIILLQFSKLLSRVLDNEPSADSEEFLKLVWENLDKLKIKLETTIIEKLAEKHPKYIEVKIVDIFLEFIRNNSSTNDMKAVWDNEQFLVTSCAKSSLIFSLVSSIMNQILSDVRNIAFVKCLQAIRSFVSQVSMICSRRGKRVIDLYPQQCHNLIYQIKCFNICEENSSESKGIADGIAETFHKTLMEKPETVITLLSHQGAWCSDL